MATSTEKIEIKIDGNSYEAYNFLNIVLTQELLKPNELRFTMQKKDLLDSEDDCSFTTPKELLGAKVTCQIISARFDQTATQQNEMLKYEGIIFKVNTYRGEMVSEQLIDVQAFSPDYLLMDHPHCISYEGRNLQGLVNSTLDPYTIPNTIDPQTTDAIPYTVQYNETNYQFLVRLAQRYGEWMYYDGLKWVFGKVQKKAALELFPRVDVLNYRYETDLIHHTVKHGHHEYMKHENPTKSDKEFAQLTETGFHGLTDQAKLMSKKLFTKETFQHLQCSNPEDNDMDELEVSMKAQLFGEKAQQTVCNGTSVRADLTLGSCITIKDFYDISDTKQGHYNQDELIVCRVVHAVDVNGNYRNEFTAISSSTQYPPYYNSDSYPKASPQRAKVIENVDPEQLGRIRVQFLWQEEQEGGITPWIRIAQPHGGHDKGFYFIPELDEEVMVGFENSNAEKPYVIGTLWHGSQLPGNNWPHHSNDIKAIRTRNGHTIEIHDEANDGYIKIYDHNKDNYILTFSTDEKLIKLESTGNIALYAVNDIILHAKNDIVQQADHCRLSTIGELDRVSSNVHNYVAGELIYMEGNEFYATGKNQATLDSTSLTQIQSDVTTNVLGNSTVLVGSGGSMEVSADAALELKADATIDIKSSAPMTLNAPVVKIN